MSQVDLKERQETREEDTAQSRKNYILSKDDIDFMRLLKEQRPILLARLQSLGLLASFLEAENGTNRAP